MNIFDVSKAKTTQNIYSIGADYSSSELETESTLIDNNNLSQEAISGIENFSVTSEVNSFLLRWTNPKSKLFSYVVVLMSHANTSAGCVFENAIPIYIGQAETYTFYLPDVIAGEVSDIPQRDYFRFWISAYQGNVLDSKGLQLWQTS